LRKGFGLITALIILVLVAGILGAVLRMADFNIKHKSDSYMGERARIFMQSVIENTLMAIEGYQRNNANGCLKKLHFVDEDGRFEANVSILRYYCYNMNDCPNCNIAEKIDTDKSHGNVVLKVVVESNKSNPRNSGFIRLERITLQRP